MAAPLTKREAAALLGTSEKTIDRETQRGRLKPVAFEQPASGGFPSPLFARKDVEKLKGARASTALVPGQTTALALRSAGAVQLMKILSEAAAVPLLDKLTLSTQEASRLSGVPVSVLTAARKSGTLPSVKLGRGFRVWQTDLVVYVESLRPKSKRAR